MLRSLLPRHLRPRREKVFGDGPRVPLDREAKVRITHLALALERKTEPGKHYGVLTAKFVAVLRALLWLIHDGKSGQCNPSYATIADKAACAASTVGAAIRALEEAGILSWVNRIHRIAVRECDLLGHWMTTRRVVRTSNAYVFHDPKIAAMRGRPANTESQLRPPDTSKSTLADASYPQPSAADRDNGTQKTALQPERGGAGGVKLSPATRAAIVARMDAGIATRADWLTWTAAIGE